MCHDVADKIKRNLALVSVKAEEENNNKNKMPEKIFLYIKITPLYAKLSH